jgi:hypothetical protein
MGRGRRQRQGGVDVSGSSESGSCGRSRSKERDIVRERKLENKEVSEAAEASGVLQDPTWMAKSTTAVAVLSVGPKIAEELGVQTQAGKAKAMMYNYWLKDTIWLILKLVFNQDQHIMETLGALYRSYRLFGDNPIAMSIIKGRDQGLGLPYLQVYVRTLIEDSMKAKVPTETIVFLKRYWQEVVLRIPLLELAAQVRMCRLRKQHADKEGKELELKKLVLRFESEESDRHWRITLTSFQAVKLVGPPPRGEMAMAAQKFIEQL